MNLAQFLIVLVIAVFALISLLPFYNVLLISFGDPAAMIKQTVYLIPTSINLSSYEYVFRNDRIVGSFLVTMFVTIAGTAISMLMTIFAAYTLTKKEMPGRNFMLVLILITMFFSGGLVPYYLTVRDVGLVNSIWVMMIPTALNTFYLMIMYSYLRTVPAALEESAKIDGANEIQILFRIIIPVSMPTIAALTLFYAVDRWNEWWHALLFLRDIEKYPIQLLLRQMLTNLSEIIPGGIGSQVAGDKVNVLPETLKMAVVVVASAPIIVLYPFLQKYFAKGIMIGSVKG